MFSTRFIRSAAIAQLWLAPLVSSARGGVATFENFNEGDVFFPSFTDPLSGIFFAESGGPSPGFWVIEFAGPFPTLPTITPGNWLNNSGFAPGPGFGINFEFGFRAILPELADRVGMDVVYATDPGALLTLEAFDSNGTRVGMSQVAPTPGNFLELHIEASSAQFDIRSLRVTASNMFAGYDNVAFTPEPLSIGLLMPMAGAVALRRRRRFTPPPQSSRSLGAGDRAAGRR